MTPCRLPEPQTTGSITESRCLALLAPFGFTSGALVWSGYRYLVALPLLVSVLLLAGCATGTSSRGGTHYGFEWADIAGAIARGEIREALAYYEQQAADLQRRGHTLEAAKAHTAASFASLRLGAYQKGVDHGVQAAALLTRQRLTREVLDSQLLNYVALGDNYLGVRDRGEARRVYQLGLRRTEALRDISAVMWSGHFSRSEGWVDFSEGDFGAAAQRANLALTHYQRFRASLSVRDSSYDQLKRDVRWWEGLSLRLLGQSYDRLGRLREADTALTQALEITRALGVKETEADVLLALGSVSVARRDYVRALSYYEQALPLAIRVARVPTLPWIYAAMGQSYDRLGRQDESLTAYRQSMALVEDLRQQLQDPGFPAAFVEDKQVIYQGAVHSALSIGRVDDAFAYSERARARAFLDLLGNQTALSKGKTRALMEEEAGVRARVVEAQVFVQSATEPKDRARARQQMDAAERSYREFLDRVRRESSEQASLMVVEPVSVQEVQALLPEGATLLEYFVTGRDSVVWIIDRAGENAVQLPTGRAEVRRLVADYRAAIAERAPIGQIEDQARALYAVLIAKARPYIHGDRLLVVPHDVLHYLPFAALQSPVGRWLVEEYTVATLPSASVLKYLLGKPEGASSGVLAVGNPDLGPALNLRYAELEARSIGDRNPTATVLIGKQATERQVKALGGQMGLLHFATHAELSATDPLASALLLVPEPPDDGRLEVREIFGLDLHARLVVLSACETGLGKLSTGDELVGLQRAFLYAGTPAVVTTLWKVDDQASYWLMRDFYKHLDTQGPAEALREAQRTIRQEFAHPFAWAAFGLTGVPW